jgi:hypothetical protein
MMHIMILAKVLRWKLKKARGGVMDFKSPSNDFDALVLALQLAITAPDDAKAQECVNHAEQLAQGFSEIDVERAKRQAYETT